jgi:hypothetical protein
MRSLNRSASFANMRVRIPSQHESTFDSMDGPEAISRSRSCPAALMTVVEDLTTAIGPATPIIHRRISASQPNTPKKQTTFRNRFHRIVSSCTSTPTKVLNSAKKNLYLSRRAICGGPPPLSLTLDISEDIASLVEECGNGRVSQLEAAFRREVSIALDIPESSVIIDHLRTPSAGCTEVRNFHLLCSICVSLTALCF